MFPVCFSFTWKVMSTTPESGSAWMSGVGMGVSKKPSPESAWKLWISRCSSYTSPGRSQSRSRSTCSCVVLFPSKEMWRT